MFNKKYLLIGLMFALMPITSIHNDFVASEVTKSEIGATIDDTFDDDALSMCVATKLGKNTTDPVSQSDLDGIGTLICNGVGNLDGIDLLTNVTNLQLDNGSIDNIDVLSGLNKLTLLYLNNNQISDITPLSELDQLTTLKMASNQISDISPIAGLKNLTVIRFNENQISNITPITDLTKLTNIDFSNNQISDITPITDLINLNYIAIGANQISDITPLSGLTNLETLHINRNQISDISALSDLTKLTLLDIYQNEITDITPLAGLTNLTSLDLNYNQISNIAPVAGLTNLTLLKFLGNQVSDISPVAGLTNLKTLYFAHNQISDISSIPDTLEDVSGKFQVINLGDIKKTTKITAPVSKNVTSSTGTEFIDGNIDYDFTHGEVIEGDKIVLNRNVDTPITFEDGLFSGTINFTRTSKVPTIETPGDVKIAEGDKLDILENVKATDIEDGDLTSAIVVDNPDKFQGDGKDALGSYHITYTVTDSETNTTSVTRTITVTAKPVIVQPGDIKITEGNALDILESVSASDIEDGDLTSKIAVDNPDNFEGKGADAVGTYEITYTVTDSDGNTVSVKRTITVTAKPVIEQPGDTRITEGVSLNILENVSASDIEDGDLTSKIAVDNPDNFEGKGTDAVGTYEITYTVLDSDGNTVSAKRTITVTAKPVIEAPGDARITEGDKLDVLENVTATDAEDGDLKSSIVVTNPSGFNGDGKDAVGTYEITYTVTDSDENTVSVKRTITVTAKPVIETPGDVRITEGDKLDVLENVTALDLEDGDLTSSITFDNPDKFNGDGKDAVGTYEITYTVTDSDENTVSVKRTITVTAKPVIETPGDIRITEGDKLDVLENVTATDTEDGDLTSSITFDNPDKFNGDGKDAVGTYEITYTVKDSDENTVSVKRTITVTAKPVIETPGDARITEGDKLDVLENVTATDTEDGDLKSSIVVTNPSGFNGDGKDAVGTYEITYTITDSDENTVSVKRTITVTAKPVINQPGDSIITEGDKLDILENVTASDAEDGDLTPTIVVTNLSTFNGDGKDAVGVYDIIYSVTDSDENTVTAERTITVKAKPVIVQPGDIKITEGDKLDVLKNVTASDIEDGDLTSSIVVTNSSDFKGDGKDAVGVYDIVYSVTDSDGNTVSEKRTITVTAKPVINQPGDSILTEGDKLDILENVSATDIEDGNLTSTIDVANPDNFKGDGKDAVGVYDIVYSVTDSDGNTTSVTRTITVKGKPVIIQPGDTEVGEGLTFDIMADVSATDAEDGDLTSKIAVDNPDNFQGKGADAVGTYEITYTVTDSDGNTTSATRTITVTEKPVITQPGDTTILKNDKLDIMKNVSATDAEDGDLTSSIVVDNPDKFQGDGSDALGSYKITYTVTDSDSNVTSVTRTIKVTEKPTLTQPGDARITEGDTLDILENVKATDNEDGDLTSTIVITNPSDFKGNGFDAVGTYEITYTVTDKDGYTASATRTITVTAKPVIVQPGDTIITEGDKLDILENVSATDVEDGDLTSAIVVTNSSEFKGDGKDAVGTYDIIYSITDSDENTTSVTRTITVKGKPVIEQPGDIKITEGDKLDVLENVSATDVEDGDLTSAIVVSNPDKFQGDGKDVVGTYEITYTVKDSDENTTSVTRTITVTAKPVIEQPGDSIITEGDKLDVLENVSASDTEDGDLTSSIAVANPDKFKGDGKDTVGVYDIIYSVTDSDENTTSVTRTITVKGKPVIEQPGDSEVGVGLTFDIMADVSATDAEDGDLTSKITVDNPDDFEGKGADTAGTYEITYTVTDSDGNTTSVTRTITVTEKPVITQPGDTAILKGDKLDILENVAAMDGEDGDLTSSIVVANPDNFQGDGNDALGTYEITYTVTDSDSNITSETRTIKVTEKPTITQPGDIRITEGDELDVLEGVKAVDNEDGDLTSSIKVTNPSNFNGDGKDALGSYGITYTVVDSDGYTVSETRTITVTAKPVIEQPGDSIITEGDKLDVLDGVSATDVEDGNLTSSIEVLNPSNFKGDGKDLVGTYEITYTITDSDENTVTAKRTITVKGKPVIEQPGDSIITEGDKLDILENVSASDTEDGDLTSSIVVTNPDNFKGDGKDVAGAYVITYTVTDMDGNVTSVERTVTVKGKPVIEEPGDAEVGNGLAFDIMKDVSATDAEDGDLTSAIVVDNPDNFQGEGKDAAGTYEITYTVTDSDGNTATETRSITVTEKPIIEEPGDTTILKGDKLDIMDNVVATDGEDGDLTSAIVVDNPDNFQGDGNDALGSYEITYTVTDSDSNITSVTRTIKVTEKPTITQPGDIRITEGDELDILEGVEAADNEDGNLTTGIIVSNPSDFKGDGKDALGSYEITYTVIDSDGYTVSEMRTIIVTAKPVIEEPGDVIITEGDKLDVLDNVSAKDNEDGGLSNAINVDNPNNFKGDGTDVAGTYTIIYTVTDSDGNVTSVTRTIVVTGKPVIEEPGDSRITEGDVLDIATNLAASDNEDGDLTSAIVVDNSDNFKGDGTDAVGTYKITYTVTDSDGNTTSVIRTIRVTAKPVIEEPGDVEITEGDSLNILNKVKATDVEDGDLTSVIVVDNPEGFKGDGTDAVGTYKITYTVTDSDGNITSEIRTITVNTGAIIVAPSIEKSREIPVEKNIAKTGLNTRVKAIVIGIITIIAALIIKRLLNKKLI